MVTQIKSATLRGLTAIPVDVEVDVGPGLPGVTIVGLADTAVNEARERVRAAFRNSGAEFPRTRVVINLAPADLKKEGTAFDLPIALGLLVAEKQNNPLTNVLVLGELALDGGVRPVPGVLPIVRTAQRLGITRFVIPSANTAEIQLVHGVTFYPVAHLQELMRHVRGDQLISEVTTTGVTASSVPPRDAVDFAVVRGQEFGKRALEIAAAGGHNVLLIGPPGTGKTLLARAFAGILPALAPEEMLEVTEIASVAGLLTDTTTALMHRPFRSPHHSASTAAIVGGGASVRPGEVTLAHRGVLFMDEFPEFHRDVIEALRQPLEDGVVTVSRAAGTVIYPARVTLVAAANPCPCGYADAVNDPGGNVCQCTPVIRMRYNRRLSGPLLDRIDLHATVGRLEPDTLMAGPVAEPSEKIRQRVMAARARQAARYDNPSRANSDLGPHDVVAVCQLDDGTTDFLRDAIRQFKLSGRSYHRVLKIARTIADLVGSEVVDVSHIAEALQYRPKMVQ